VACPTPLLNVRGVSHAAPNVGRQSLAANDRGREVR